jgi:predicted O-methyltransferase YrrM
MLKELIRRFGRTGPGKQVVHAAVMSDPAALRFPNVAHSPAELRGFEDLAFLFSSNQLNHGIASLQIDEAALLYRLARDVDAGAVVEIGRFKGGSTVVFAAALRDGVELWSYDAHVALRPDLPGSLLDAELLATLERYGLAPKVHLLVGDSKTVDPPPGAIRLLFVDGDHSYEGARADFERWGALVAPGGRVLFHDAVDTGGYGNVYPGVARAVAEIGDGWTREAGAGTIASFQKWSSPSS